MEGEAISSWAVSAERIQNPLVFPLVMAKDIEIAVIRTYPETTIPDAVPPVQDLQNFKRPGPFGPGTEAKGPFVCFVAGVTLNVESRRHHRPPALKGQFAADGLGVVIRESHRLDGNSGLHQNILR